MIDNGINELLAIEVMGWSISVDRETGREYYYTKSHSLCTYKDEWRPTENVEQALMCAEALTDVEEIEISFPRVDGGIYIARIFEKRKLYEGKARTKELAICLALVEAVKK